ncbi:MFS transporter [Spirulina subsalsa]|uniref:MFS transporter n=1 Tax=Spirulina subsalsa TaxID=54311 RepID=UPI0002D9E118|nr:MFS transporter [Spirulina subsalsa]
MKSWFPQLPIPVWILAFGRLLSQVGTGFTLFYAPIFFVNQVGLSTTQVGLALGSQAVSGIVGRFVGGSLSDSPEWGRRKTLLLSAAISALADGVFFLTHNFPLLVLGCLCMGLGIGLYWPATEAVVADSTGVGKRDEAFAVTRLADMTGLGVGVILGGFMATLGLYRWLFVVDGISFVLFFGLIYGAIAETRQGTPSSETLSQRWVLALGDRLFLIYLVVNVLFTTYISQIQSSLPLYFTKFVPGSADGIGFPPQTISLLFSFHIVLAALLQLPMVRILSHFSRPHALMCSLCGWGVGFTCVWLTGQVSDYAILPAFLSLGILAASTVSYVPFASSFVVDLAPPSLRGIYLSLNSQCWAIGYLIGPPLGGWALDQTPAIVHGFWVLAALSTGGGLLILGYLQKLWRDRTQS